MTDLSAFMVSLARRGLVPVPALLANPDVLDAVISERQALAETNQLALAYRLADADGVDAQLLVRATTPSILSSLPLTPALFEALLGVEDSLVLEQLAGDPSTTDAQLGALVERRPELASRVLGNPSVPVPLLAQVLNLPLTGIEVLARLSSRRLAPLLDQLVAGPLSPAGAAVLLRAATDAPSPHQLDLARRARPALSASHQPWTLVGPHVRVSVHRALFQGGELPELLEGPSLVEAAPDQDPMVLVQDPVGAGAFLARSGPPELLALLMDAGSIPSASLGMLLRRAATTLDDDAIRTLVLASLDSSSTLIEAVDYVLGTRMDLPTSLALLRAWLTHPSSEVEPLRQFRWRQLEARHGSGILTEVTPARDVLSLDSSGEAAAYLSSTLTAEEVEAFLSLLVGWESSFGALVDAVRAL